MRDCTEETSVWAVLDADYDRSWIVAVYPTQALADSHVALMGGWVDEQLVRNDLHPDATDPTKQAERAAETAREKAKWQAYQEQSARDARLVREQQPHPPHMSLCHCQTFTSRSAPTAMISWTGHGYCPYCGGWSPAVFRQQMGEDALHAAIDKLAEHDRVKMRAIVSATG